MVDFSKLSAEPELLNVGSQMYTLSGIIWDEDDPVAILNIKSKKVYLNEGSNFFKYKVIEIKRKYVRLQYIESDITKEYKMNLGEKRFF